MQAYTTVPRQGGELRVGGKVTVTKHSRSRGAAPPMRELRGPFGCSWQSIRLVGQQLLFFAITGATIAAAAQTTAYLHGAESENLDDGPCQV